MKTTAIVSSHQSRNSLSELIPNAHASSIIRIQLSKNRLHLQKCSLPWASRASGGTRTLVAGLQSRNPGRWTTDAIQIVSSKTFYLSVVGSEGFEPSPIWLRARHAANNTSSPDSVFSFQFSVLGRAQLPLPGGEPPTLPRERVFFKSRAWGSNPQPQAPKAHVLPIAPPREMLFQLFRIMLVRVSDPGGA